MSRFFSDKYRKLTPYTPGEQPRDASYIKLNTNENPFPPSEKAIRAGEEALRSLMLYSDPACTLMVRALAETCHVGEDQVICVNGSDEILNFAFMAFCDEAHPAVFPDVTYGFYPVFAKLNRVPYTEIPLQEDLSIRVSDYYETAKTIFLANPNAPTGIALPLSEVEEIIRRNPDNVVVIDEAYVDFGAESAVSLVNRYENLLVVQTFSKSRSLAGGRLGYGIGSASLIRDLNTIRFSTNPYNVNTVTMAAGAGALADPEYTAKNCEYIQTVRAYTTEKLRDLGFTIPESSANFIFASHPDLDGEALYQELKKRGILIRHFSVERIRNWNRITIGKKEDMDALIREITDILGGQGDGSPVRMGR